MAPSGVLTVELMGGLGNQLFQIATAYAYSKKYNLGLVLIRDWPHPEGRLPIWDEYLDPKVWNMISHEDFKMTPWLTISEKGFSYAALRESTAYLTKLFGYFQSALYFNDYAADLRKLFYPKDDLLAKSAMSLITAGVTRIIDWIGAHVRRGDYLKAADYHLICGPEYYTGARDFIEEKLNERVRVCWFSEDPMWVRDNLFSEGDTIISDNGAVDFTSLGQFKHLILSNSSYSWWAAWLNPYCYEDASRVICSPDKWFGPGGPQDDSTIREPGWFVIDTKSGNLVAQV